MRTLPTAYNYTALYQNGIIAHYASVVIYNQAQTSSVDLTSYDGVDLVRQVSLSDNIDDPGLTCKLSLQRDVYKKSIAPTNAKSKWNQGASLVFVGLRVAVYFASVPVDVTPVSGDFILVADQSIDQMEFSKDAVEVTCSDRIIALLRNSYIDTQRTYGTTGTALESVMQGIIDDNINTPLGYTVGNGKKITLQLPGGSPGFLLATGYPCPKQSVLDALTTLAGMVGWSLRSKWVTGLSAFGLAFYAPNRSVATSLFSFPPTVLIDITQAQISKTDIRNYIYGFYTDGTTGLRQPGTPAIDSTSIAKYGDPPMKMELTEAATSQINSLTQMNALLNNALADLKDPVCQYQVTLPLFIAAEISDAYTLQADDVVFDSDQAVGLTQLTHTLGRNAATSQMTLNGSLPGQYRLWFQGEARPGVSPATNNLDPAGPTISLGTSVGEIVVNYTVADQSNWQTTEVYIGGGTFSQPAQVNNKNVRPVGATLAAKGKLAHFTINALTPGGFYYVGVVVIDRDGNVGTMSALQSILVQSVGPYHENISGQQDQLIRNPDINIYTLGQGQTPDGWNLATYSNSPYQDIWASSFVDTSNQVSGKLAVAFAYSSLNRISSASEWTGYLNNALNNTTFFPSGSTSASTSAGHIFYSKPVPINGSEFVNALVSLKGSAAGSSTGFRGILYVLATTSAGVVSVAAAMTIIPTAGMASYALPPFVMAATARFVSVGLVVLQDSSNTQTMYVDRFYLNRGMAQVGQLFQTAGDITVATGSTYQLGCSAAANGTVGTNTQGYTILSAGMYDLRINLYGYCNVNGATTNVALSILISNDNGSTYTAIATTGALFTNNATSIVCGTTAQLAVGARIKYTLYTANNGFTIAGSTYPQYQSLSIQQTARADR